MPSWFDSALTDFGNMTEDQRRTAFTTAQQQPLRQDEVRPLAVPGLQPSAQDPRAFFQSLFPGDTLTPQALAAQEQALAAQGIRLLGPNAAGMRTKIELPNGQIVDVIGGAGAGHNRSQWMVDGGPGANGPGVPSAPSGGTSLAALGGGSLASREAAHAGSPGYQFIMKEALRALDRSAASRGTILTGGHLKDLQDRAAGLASVDFGNEFGRNLSLAQLGFNAASTQGGYGSMYGNQITDLTTGAGNARAAGTVASGNAYGQALGNIGQSATDLYGMYRYGQRYPNGGYGGGYYPPPGSRPGEYS